MREGWLVKRHESLLPMMRRHEVGMWIVVNEEFHDDPLTQYVAPPRPYTGNRDIFIFVDGGAEGLKKFAITGYIEENLGRFFEAPTSEPLPAAATLKALYDRWKPNTIALGIGGSRGQTRSLGDDSHRFISEAMGPEAVAKFVPAAPLVIEYLDTRLPEELEHYRAAVVVTEEIVRRALSAEVITPGARRLATCVTRSTTCCGPRGWGRGSSPTFGCSARVRRTRPRAGFSRWRARAW